MPISDQKPATELSPNQRIGAERFGRYSLLLLALLLAGVFLYMIRGFILAIILAAVFAGLFYPFYQALLKLTRHRRTVSSFICCIVLLLGLLIPAYAVSNLVVREAATFFVSMERLATNQANQQGGIIHKLKENKWVKRLRLETAVAQVPLGEWTTRVAGLVATIINRASRGTFELITTVFLTFLTLFYFFRDGELLLARLKYISPLPESYEEEFIRRFVSVARATIKGTLLVGLLKGLLGGITLWAFGIPAPVLWGVVMVFLAVLPVVGAYIVMYPAAIVLLIQGQVWQGIALFLIAALIIGSLDNILEPFVVARDAGLHDLVVFFSMLGGIGMFGVMGFIVGPIVASLFLTALEVYSIEFKRQLDWVHQRQVPEVAPPTGP